MLSMSRSHSRNLLLTGILAGMVLAATPSRAQEPPPSLGRLFHLMGQVSVQPNGSDDWAQAENNMVIGPGDRIVSVGDGNGVLQIAEARAYFSPNADVTLVNIDQNGVELGVAHGVVVIFSDGFPGGMSLSVSTPNGAVRAMAHATFRIDIHPDSTVFTNYEDSTQLGLNGGGGFSTNLNPLQAIALYGTNPVSPQGVPVAPPDGIYNGAATLEQARLRSPSAQYVSREMIGYTDLDGAGDWQPQSQYGPIWFPHVDAGWAPYHNGHWVHRFFFGWTWVADEPWGAAPFHYGRWVNMGGRWGWIPGPREIHPVWSPAQVVFAGGVQVGGVGVSVWFPLGPGEAYKPWYPCSPTYINQINITNIRPAPAVHVQVNYVTVVNNVTNITYVNHTSVVAMNTSDFAAGRPAAKVAVKVDIHVVENIKPSAPSAPAPAHPVIEHPAPKPANVPAARPVLIDQHGKAVAAAPGAKPVEVPVSKAAPPAKPAMAAKPAMTAKPDDKKPEAKPETTPAKPEAKKPEAKPASPPAKTDTAKPEAKPEAAPKDKPKDTKKKDDKKTPPPEKPSGL